MWGKYVMAAMCARLMEWCYDAESVVAIITSQNHNVTNEARTIISLYLIVVVAVYPK